MAALGRIRLSPWLIALAALSFLISGSPFLWAGLACVFLHEMGHALCARACGAVVEGIEIAPFGGVARIRGLEQLPVGRSVLVALAGPAVNALLAMICGCLAYALPQRLALWARLMDINLVLLLFNLLPAYPMDGGRMLCAMLRGRAGYARAQRLTAGLGVALGVVIMALGLAAMHYLGKLNVTLLICGAYVVFAAGQEKRGAPFSYLQTMAGREAELRRRQVLPVRTIAVRQNATDAEVFAKLLPGAMYRIVYVDDDLRVTRSAWEGELLGGVYNKARGR